MIARVATIMAFCSITLLLAGQAEGVTGKGRHIQEVPRGSQWLVGHSGLNPHAGFASVPEAFLQKYGGTWSARRSGPSGNFTRFWGEGLQFDVAVMHDELVAESAAESFWRENEYLLPRGVTGADLQVRVNTSWKGIRLVSFSQYYQGTPVLGTTAYGVFVAGRMVLFGVNAFGVSEMETQPQVGANSAREAAVDALSSRGIQTRVENSRLAVMPLVDDDTTTYRLVWEVELDGSPLGRWTAYVDAADGSLFALRDERLFMDATINLKHHDRNPSGAFIEEPAYYMDLITTGGNATTDIDGDFTVTGATATVAAELSGDYVTVENQSGTDAVLDAGIAEGETYLWETDAGEAEQAQLDVYVFTAQVHAHTAAHQDDIDWLEEPVAVRPNHIDMDGDTNQDFCNAWSDGTTINFLMAGSYSPSYACNNTAMLADVVFHEYGHGIHIQNVYTQGAGVFDEAVSESFADTMSVSITNDPHLAAYFFTTGQYLRDLEPDMVWPDDISEDPHQTGLILGGALWDLRVAFMDDLGEAAGRALTDEIFFDMLRLTGDMPSSYEAALVADDDNGNIADGTPNLCTIYENFAQHGLLGDSVGLVDIQHAQIEDIDQPADAIEVLADVAIANEECSTLGDVSLVYSLDMGDTWESVAMDVQSGDTYRAEIPPQEEGSVVYYRIEAIEDDSGDTVTKPNNIAEPYYKVYVGPLEMIFCDDFETANDEWTHELISGEDIEGADDWQWGEPNGKGGDPETAYSGSHVWGNDLAPLENWNGQYQADRINTLISPVWDLSDHEVVRLRFRRWLGVEDAFYDKANVYVNEQLVWTNFESPGAGDDHQIHHQDKEWILEDIDISEYAGGESEVQVRWEIQSDQGLQFAGWNLDDVCMYTVGTGEEYPDAGEEDSGTTPQADAGTSTIGAKSGCGCDTAGSAEETGSLLRLIATLL